MSQDMPMGRRSVLKMTGVAAGGAVAGGAGLLAFTGGAAAGHTTLQNAAVQAVATDDGKIEYVAFGGTLRYEWDGLDKEATHGEYVTEARVLDGDGQQISGWQTLGSDKGELGANWGGDNDPDSGPGTEGYFTFRYGHKHGQPDYAVAYTQAVADSESDDGDNDAVTTDYGPNGLFLVDADPNSSGYQSPFDTSLFNVSTDGATERTNLEVKHTCRVYDSEGNVIGVPDEASGVVPVDVTNEPAEGHTSGDMDGSAGGDST